MDAINSLSDLTQDIHFTAPKVEHFPWKLLVISVLAHGLVLYLWQWPISAYKEKQIRPALKTIKAKLVFAKPETSTIVVEKTESETEPQILAAPTINETEKPPVAIKQQKENQPQPDTTEIEQIQKDTPLSKSPTNKKRESQTTLKMTRQYMRNLNAEHQLKMANEQAQNFRFRQISPLIKPSQIPQLSEQEKLVEDLTVKANCDGVARKVTAVMTGLLGGMIKCSAPPDAGQYIKQRQQRMGIRPATQP
ncbi:hypothetical protein [Neptunicella marina]|uniref:Uncharacterized protein n=1 Tax=Neptunicella marina TaxID=2125989 RepID=A0A8J6J117_9ALTE|nr:hypothetical protein [Neptunicella marina]MBC3767733.1 hypothetical protein [Neptunicella marina]